jgi:nucleoid-associated protein YgaU
LATTGGYGAGVDRFQFPQQFGRRTIGDNDDEPTTTEPTTTTSTTTPPGGQGQPGGGQPGQQPGGAEQASSHRVVPGDNLWTIARDHLAEVRGRPAAELSDREIAVYWLKVIKANRARLKSGDLDLIYPGERIVLPPVE